MARRRRKGGRRSRGGIPIVQTATLAYPIVNAWSASGGNPKSFIQGAIYDLTGIVINPATGLKHNPVKGLTMAAILIAESTLGAKIANKVGANRILKKATGNLVKLM